MAAAAAYPRLPDDGYFCTVKYRQFAFRAPHESVVMHGQDFTQVLREGLSAGLCLPGQGRL